MPTSLRKLESARANGAKSTGPTTDHGRRAVALNAVKHGLSAQTVILQNESAEEYQAELQDYLDHFRPHGPSELHLVHQVAAAGWRLARYAGVESALIDRKMDEQAKWVNKEHRGISDKQRIAIAFNALAESGPSLALVNRYEARLHHEYQRILKSLLHLQARRAAEAKLQNEPNPASEQVSAPPVSEPLISVTPVSERPLSEPRPLATSIPDASACPPASTGLRDARRQGSGSAPTQTTPIAPPTPIYSNKRGPDDASP